MGGTTDYAGPGTTAAATSLLLDFSVQPLAWVTEQTGISRVVSCTVLLVCLLDRHLHAAGGQQCAHALALHSPRGLHTLRLSSDVMILQASRL